MGKSCILCKTAGRPAYTTHYLRNCGYLPDYDKRRMSGSSRFIGEEGDNTGECSDDDQEEEENLLFNQPSIKRVSIEPFPYLKAFY